MSFQAMPEGDADNTGLPEPVTFQPTDFRDKSGGAKLGEKHRTWWDVEEGCPIPSCRWYGRKDIPSRIMIHMRGAHKWGPFPWDLDFEPALTGMVGGVHIDEFLQPVPPEKGTRGKDKSEKAFQNRSDGRKRYKARVLEEWERQRIEREARWAKKQKMEADTMVLDKEK
jgi:hypothetical protein